jgi:rod shape-determining protein MreD
VKDEALWVRFDRFSRNLLPLSVTLCLVLLSVVPVPIPGYALVVPLFSLCAVYYWSVNRPQSLPPVAIFALGLIQDSLSGTPFGLHAVMMLLTYGMVVSQRRFFIGKSFGVIWWGFMLVALISIAVAWLLASAASWHIVRPGPAGFQYLLTLALYPVAALILTGAQRLMPSPR